MDTKQLLELADVLELQQVKLDGEKGQLMSECPFARWTHSKGSDSHPSFGITTSVKGSGVPGFKCHACGQSGGLFDLVNALQFYQGRALTKAFRVLKRIPEVWGDASDHTPQAYNKRRVRIETVYENGVIPRQVVPVPKDILAKYPLLYEDNSVDPAIYEYLEQERKILPQVSKLYGLRQFTNDWGKKGVIFPKVTFSSKTVVDLWVRMIDVKRDFRLTSAITGSQVNYESPQTWFGGQFRIKEAPLIIVEGAFDCLRLRSLLGRGANIMASLGGPTQDQISQLTASVIYLGFDADEAGAGFNAKAAEWISSTSRVYTLNWADVGFKDAGQLQNLEQFLKVRDNSKLVERTTPLRKLSLVKSKNK